jgi:hypothetical protein
LVIGAGPECLTIFLLVAVAGDAGNVRQSTQGSLRIVKADVSVHVKCQADAAMPRQMLRDLGRSPTLHDMGDVRRSQCVEIARPISAIRVGYLGRREVLSNVVDEGSGSVTL